MTVKVRLEYLADCLCLLAVATLYGVVLAEYLAGKSVLVPGSLPHWGDRFPVLMFLKSRLVGCGIG